MTGSGTDAVWPRKRARLIVIKALYPEVATGVGSSAEAALSRASDESGWRRCDRKFAEVLIRKFFSEREVLVAMVRPFLSRPFASVPPVVKLLLLLGCLELRERISPLKVVVSEYGFLDERYSDGESRGFLQAIYNLVEEQRSSSSTETGNG